MAKVFEAVIDDKIFRIEEDFPEVGAYLYVFEKGKCISDSLQDNVELCKTIALELYNVSNEEWRLKEVTI